MNEKKFFDEYSWKQALVTSVVLLVGGLFISLLVHSNGLSKNFPIDLTSYFYFIVPTFLFISFFPVIMVESIISPLQNKFRK